MSTTRFSAFALHKSGITIVVFGNTSQFLCRQFNSRRSLGGSYPHHDETGWKLYACRARLFATNQRPEGCRPTRLAGPDAGLQHTAGNRSVEAADDFEAICQGEGEQKHGRLRQDATWTRERGLSQGCYHGRSRSIIHGSYGVHTRSYLLEITHPR